MHVFCYVQHLLGTGHQWRIAAISRELEARGITVTYVSGGMPLPDLDVGKARFVQLPPARAADIRFKQLLDEHDQPVDETWRQRRRDQLLRLFAEARPDVLLVETFPFGRRLLRFEILPLLEAAHTRQPRPRIACSVRDILEYRPRPDREQEIVEWVERYFDIVLVHSDPRLVPFEVSFPGTARIADKLCYTGYVLSRSDAGSANGLGVGEVLVSAGGSAFGEHVLRAAVAARPLSALAGRTWRVLVGHGIARSRFEDLRSLAADGIVIERSRADFPRRLKNCAVSVSQGGYNTVLEVLDAGTPAVIVPYADDREKEQAVRARLLAARGLIHMVDNQALTAPALAEAIDLAAATPRRGPPAIDMRGAVASAELIAAHAGR